MSRGPKAVSLDLSEQEQDEIQRLLRRHGTGQALVSRLRIILACAEPGATNLGVATALGVSRQTVALWRSRFAAHRLEGLVDAPRSGAPRSIDDAAVERLVALILEEAPANATHWSTRSMARRTGMSQSAVSRIWRAFGLRPHQADTFKLSADPAFVEKVRDGSPSNPFDGSPGRWSLPRPTRSRAGAVRRREAADPGGAGYSCSLSPPTGSG